MREIFGQIKRLLGNKKGNVAMIAGLLSPLFLGAAALSADYVIVFNKVAKLQDAADSAALAGARELGIAGNDDDEVEAITHSYAHSNFYQGTKEDPSVESLTVKTDINDERKGLEVNLEYHWKPFFAHMLDSDVLPLHVKAKANLSGGSSICTLALDQSGQESISLTGKSSIYAKGCSIQSNSVNRAAISVAAGSKIISDSICSAGGFRGSANAFSPAPINDCPEMDDPLRDRQLPRWQGKCNYKDVLIFDTSRTLKPGIYCGGVTLINNARVRFSPGVYTFVNGDLDVASGSEIKGTGVSLYFAVNSRLFLRNDSIVSLTAPKTGPMAGILVSSGRSNNRLLDFAVKSRDARKLTGLFYLPGNRLVLGDDTDNDGVCDTKDDEYRLPHVEGHTHQHIHPDGTVHTHYHFMTATFPSRNGITYHDARSHAHNSAKPGSDCEASIGRLSDWTAIIAKQVAVTSGVDLILNADYSGSTIPVPMNDGSVGVTVSLTE